jgi:hypothetical protein
MSQQYNDSVSHNEGEKVLRTINEVMCEKKVIWKGESKTPPEDLHRAMLIGGWEPIEELRDLLTKILSMQDAGQRTRARVCRASASNLNRRLPENPFTRHPGQKNGSLQFSNTTKQMNSAARQKEQLLDDCEIRTHAPKDRGIGD